MFRNAFLLITEMIAAPAVPIFCCALGAGLLLVVLLQWRKFLENSDTGRITDILFVCYVALQFLPHHSESPYGNAIHAAIALAFGLCFYFLLRFVPKKQGPWTLLFRAAAGIALYIAALDLIVLYREAAALKIFSGASLVAMRSALTILGNAPKNDNLMVLLLLLPISTLAWINDTEERSPFRWLGMLSAASVLSVLLLGFSRGIYLALAAFVLFLAAVLWRRVLGVRKQVVLGGVFILLVAIVPILALAPSHFFTRSVAPNVSEGRSVSGRLLVWCKRSPLIKEHWLLGLGPGSDGTASLATISQGAEAPFTAASYSLPLELLQTGGVLGFAVFSMFLLSVFGIGLRAFKGGGVSWEQRSAAIFAVGLLAACVRELTYTSITTNPACIFLFFGICGAIVALQAPKPVALESPEPIAPSPLNREHFALKTQYLAIIAAVMACAVGLLGLSLQRAEAEYAAGCQSLATGDDSSALPAFNSANSHRWKNPMFDAGVGTAYARTVFGDASSVALFSPLPLASPEARATLRSAKAAFTAAITQSPNDATLWCNLGWIDAFLRDNDGAEFAFRQAIKVDPYDFPSLISMGLFYERAGHASDAPEFYAQAVAVSPGVLRSEFWAQLKARQATLADAVIQCSLRLIQSQPESPIREARLGAIDAYLGDGNTARKEYIRATSSLPDLSYAWSNFADLMSSPAERPARMDALHRALLLDPRNVDAAAQLAEANLETGDKATAEQFYERALALPQYSPHAERVSRVYGLKVFVPDDLVPSGFLSYVTPRPGFVKLCGSDWSDMLSQLSFSTPLLQKRIDEQNEYCGLQPASSGPAGQGR